MDIGAIPATVVSGSSGASVTRCLSGESASSTWDVLTNEMKRYEYEIGPSGGISYSAPSGFHDDCVMALALANHRRWETESCGRMMAVVTSGRRRVATAQRRQRALAG